MRIHLTLAACFTALLLVAFAAKEGGSDPRLKNSFRQPAKNGWIQVHLEGTPAEVGYQHGYHLSQEIQDGYAAVLVDITHDAGEKDRAFFRRAAEAVLWPHIEAEYRQELQGIVAGQQARGGKLDIWDVVVLNAFMELSPYYTNWYDEQKKLPGRKRRAPGEHCSAFVATGSMTKDGHPVIAHNNWTGYAEGARWNILFDVVPAGGQRFLMDGYPGLIHSGDDFGINAAGLMITETTISGFHGFDPQGVPEFVRARKAMQYATTIDEFVRLMKTGNNGGYANTWLVADRKTDEIARLELGLQNVTLDRTTSGYFVGSNFPLNPKLVKAETTFDVTNLSLSPNARRLRADALMEQNKGRIDVAFAKQYLSDHYDSFDKREQPNERTLCGHIDLSPRGSEPWMPSFGIGGAVQAKVADAAMAREMRLEAHLGHSCGIGFKAAEHLKAHPQFAYQKDVLLDMPAHGWASFAAAGR